MYSCTPEGVIMVAMKEAEKKGIVFPFFREGTWCCAMCFALSIAYEATNYYLIYSITNFL